MFTFRCAKKHTIIEEPQNIMCPWKQLSMFIRFLRRVQYPDYECQTGLPVSFEERGGRSPKISILILDFIWSFEFVRLWTVKLWIWWFDEWFWRIFFLKDGNLIWKAKFWYSGFGDMARKIVKCLRGFLRKSRQIWYLQKNSIWLIL